jgi:hypothetical protein
MDEDKVSQRKGEELATLAENVLGMFGGRHSSCRLSSSLSKHRMTEQAKEDVQESMEAIKQYNQDLANLEVARQHALDAAGSQWGEVANNITDIPVFPKKSDIYINLFAVAWRPYYLVTASGQIVEISTYGA